jgi:death on curing protein
MAGIVWPLEATVRAIHYRQIAEHGGSEGLRDEGLFLSARARPQNLLAHGDRTPDLAASGAAYGFGIARDHPFVDGNKRTALVAMRTFLLLNRADLKSSQEEKYLTILSLAEGTLTEANLADWIRQRT